MFNYLKAKTYYMYFDIQHNIDNITTRMETTDTFLYFSLCPAKLTQNSLKIHLLLVKR